MARQIDEKIVQMTFNNQQFEKNAQQTISTLDKLKQSLNFSKQVDGFNDIEKAARGLDLSGITIATSKISEGFSVMEEIATGALRRIGEWAVNTGSQLLKAMTIDPFRISWAKYDESIASEQAIMSAVEGKVDAEGKAYDMEAVVERVERLKWFADETSYSITQMTNALGQFTASGQDLDKSVTAVMGIANACADAGVSTQKAESAFIGFAKAIGSGTLTLGTWNMQLKTSGLTNSERFRKTLLESAAAMGTLTKEADKFYFKGEEITTANFTEYLSKGIITADALIDTLNRYADTTLTIRDIQTQNVESIVDLYKTANKEMSSEMAAWVADVEQNGTTASDAIEHLTKAYEELGIEVPQSLKALRRAQEAISFTQAIEATAEAVTSQFSNIYHLMVGNYEEAKALWSSMADALNEWFVGPLYDLVDVFGFVKTSWNNMEWDSSKGEKPVTQLLAIWNELAEAIDNIINGITVIWKEVFNIPEIEESAKSIFDFLEKIRLGLKSFNDLMNTNPIEKQQANGWDAFFTLLEAILMIIKRISDAISVIINSFIKPLGNKLKPILEDIFVILDDIGRIIFYKLDRVSDNFGPLESILSGILNILDPIITLIAKGVKRVREFTDILSNAEFTNTKKEVSLLGKAFEFVGKVFEFLGNMFTNTKEAISDLGNALSGVFDTLKGYISDFLKANGTDVSKLAEGGLIAYLIYGLSTAVKKLKGIDAGAIFDKLKEFLGGKSQGLIDTIKETFNTLTDSIKSFTESIKVKMLDTISNALVKLAAALLIISLIPSDRLGESLGAITLVLGEMIGTLAVVSKINGKGMNKTALAFDQLAAGILVLSLALKILSTIDTNSLMVSIGGLTLVLGAITAFIAMTNELTKGMKDTKLSTLSSFMKAVGVSMIELSISLKILSSINLSDMGVAILGIVSVLGSISLFIAATNAMTKGMDNKKLSTLSSFLSGIGFALIELSLAMKLLSSINLEQMGVAILGLGSILLAIGMFSAAMSKVSGAGSFVAVSAGMIILSTAILMLTAALAVMGKLGWEVIGEGLKMLFVALAEIGVLGVAIGLAAPYFIAFSAALLIFGVALNTIFGALSKAIQLFAAFKVIGGDFAKTMTEVLTQAFSALLATLPAFLLGLIDAVINILDEVKVLIVKLLDTIISAVTELLPRIIELGVTILKSLLQGIRDNIYEVTTLCVEIVTEFLRALGENTETLVTGILQFLVNVINGLAESIREMGGEIGTAIGNLAAAIIEGLVSAVINAPLSFFQHIGEGIASFFNGDTAKRESETAGQDVYKNVQSGMETQEPILMKHVDDTGKAVTDTMDRTEDATTSGTNTLSGLLAGVSDPELLAQLFAAGETAGLTFMDGYNSKVEIHSPSREMEKRGLLTIQGLIQGLRQTSGLEKASISVGELVMDTISKAVEIANSIMEDDLHPVITPVLDLSEIQNGGGLISSLLGTGSYNLANSYIPLGNIYDPFNEAKPSMNNTINIDFNVKTEGELNEASIHKYGRILADVVDVELGKRYS